MELLALLLVLLVPIPRTEFVSAKLEFFSVTNALLNAQLDMEILEVFAKNVMKTVPHVMELNQLALNA